MHAVDYEKQTFRALVAAMKERSCAEKRSFVLRHNLPDFEVRNEESVLFDSINSGKIKAIVDSDETNYCGGLPALIQDFKSMAYAVCSANIRDYCVSMRLSLRTHNHRTPNGYTQLEWISIADTNWVLKLSEQQFFELMSDSLNHYLAGQLMHLDRIKEEDARRKRIMGLFNEGASPLIE